MDYKQGDLLLDLDEGELNKVIEACIQFNTVGAPSLTRHQRTLIELNSAEVVVVLAKRLEALTKRLGKAQEVIQASRGLDMYSSAKRFDRLKNILKGYDQAEGNEL